MTSSIRCKPLFVLFAVFFAFYSVYWYLNNPRLLVLLTITISLILILGLCAAYAKVYHRLKSEWVFLALLIAFLIIFIFIFPPFTVPDEGHHFFSTYWMVDSLPFNAHVTNDGGFLVRDIDLSLYKVARVTPLTPLHLIRLFRIMLCLRMGSGLHSMSSHLASVVRTFLRK